MVNWTQHYATRANRMQASEIRELLKLVNQPDIVSFGGGVPDANLFPRTEIAAAYQRVLNDPACASAALQYSVSEGYLPLREWIAGYMQQRGVVCEPDNILITNGSQQGLDFIGKLFISPGDTVLTDWPTYLGALQAFNAYEAQYDVLPSSHNNRTPESYDTNGAHKPKFGYAMPEFQNPSGITLTREERLALLDSADKMDIPLIEDSPYEKLRYEGKAEPLLLALAAERAGGIDKCRVIHLGTFSKSIVPSLRIGWMVGPKTVIQKMVLIKQASDLHTSPLNQMVMHEVAPAIIDTHAAKMCAVYKRRRDAMLSALAMHMPEGVSWTKPEGGLFVFVTLPEEIDAAVLLQRAIEEARVAFVPGGAFYPDRSRANTLRLSYSPHDAEVIEPAMQKLGQLIQSMMDEAPDAARRMA